MTCESPIPLNLIGSVIQGPKGDKGDKGDRGPAGGEAAKNVLYVFNTLPEAMAALPTLPEQSSVLIGANLTQEGITKQFTVSEGSLTQVKYLDPVAYSSGLNVSSSLTTVSKDGAIYAPDPEIVPFVTGAWNPAQWRVVQNTNSANLVYRFPSIGAAQSAAATLPDGSNVEVPGESSGIVSASNYVPLTGPGVVTLEDYVALRSYSGKETQVFIPNRLFSGNFARLSPLSAKPDDGGVTIVGTYKWGRLFSGAVHSAWFEGMDPTGRLFSTDAMQKAINAAVASSGILQMYTGQYKLGNYTLSSAGGNGYKGGCLILGGPVQLPDTAVVFLQTNLAIPVLDVDAINTGLDGLMFKVWAGDIAADGGVPITVLSTTANTITLSADPWPGQSPILWTPETVHTSTDGTAFPTLMQFSVMGSWYASGATKNGDGTVTLTGVKGANGTPNSQISNLVGHSMESFISLPHLTSGDGENRGAIKHSIRENQMFRRLWFTQVENAFVYTEFGSGGGPGVGIGNAGFMDDVVLDLGKSLIWAPKDINGLQATNVQSFGATRYTFHAPYGVVRSVNLATFKQYIGRVVRAQGLSAFTFNGNEVNGYDGTGYSDYAFNIGSEGIEGSTIVGCAMGRARYPVIQVTGDIKNSAIGANSFRSNGDGGTNQAAIVANDIIGSNLMGNAFGRLHSSWQYSIQLLSPTATLAGTSLDADLFGRVVSTPVLHGWRGATLNSGWTVADVAVQFCKIGNVVRLRGTFKGSGGTPVMTLPAGFRPESNIRVVLPFDNGTSRTLGTITPDGNLYVSDAVSTWCDLSAVSFVV